MWQQESSQRPQRENGATVRAPGLIPLCLKRGLTFVYWYQATVFKVKTFKKPSCGHPVFTPAAGRKTSPLGVCACCVTFGSLVWPRSRHLAAASATRGQRNPTPRNLLFSFKDYLKSCRWGPHGVPRLAVDPTGGAAVVTQ